MDVKAFVQEVTEKERIRRSDELRRFWMAKLAMMTSPAFPVDAGKVLASFLPDLKEYGDEYFTDEVRRLVARAPRRQAVPSYDEICQVLSEWWRDNRPRQLALAAPAPEPERTPPTEAERQAVTDLLAQFHADLASRVRASPAPLSAIVSTSLPPIRVLDEPSANAAVQQARGALAARRQNLSSPCG